MRGVVGLPGQDHESENGATRSAGTNGRWAAAAGGRGAVLLTGLGFTDAPPGAKCAIVGHPWPAVWELVPGELPGDGLYRRVCSGCGSVEVVAEWAWFG